MTSSQLRAKECRRVDSEAPGRSFQACRSLSRVPRFSLIASVVWPMPVSFASQQNAGAGILEQLVDLNFNHVSLTSRRTIHRD